MARRLVSLGYALPVAAGRERGASLLGLVFSLAVIVIATALLLGLWQPEQKGEAPATPQEQLGKAEAAACLSNRSVARAYYASWKIEHPDQEPDRSILPPGTRCQAGGEYRWRQGGTLLCSEHTP